MIIVAVVLAIMPYLILRGLVTRLARRQEGRHQRDSQTPPGGSPTESASKPVTSAKSVVP